MERGLLSPTPSHLRVSYDAYCKISSEIYMIQDTLDNLNLELERLEDTWVEHTPIMGCIQTSIDVVEHILNEKQGIKDNIWTNIEKLRLQHGGQR
jgi:hypothetical protein|tara:strand:- start:890 stop:1174 length:285 start_codon:yes stop_codon:yes gene_type:complete